MIVFKPETVTKLHISINTKEDADLLRALALCANSHLSKLSQTCPKVQFIGVDDSVSWQELADLIDNILSTTRIYSKQFKHEDTAMYDDYGCRIV